MDNKLSVIEHLVINSKFFLKKEVENNEDKELSVNGGISIPKTLDTGKTVKVQLKFEFGKEEESFFLMVETMTTFEIKDSSDLTEEAIQIFCKKYALAKLRNTVKNVTVAFGLSTLDLPPFAEE